MTHHYTSACESWAVEEDVVTLRDGATIIGQFPLEFLLACEVTRTTKYLKFVVRELLCLQESDELRLIFQSGESRTADDADLVRPGEYLCVVPESASPRLLQGPQGKSLSRPFRDTDGTSTVSKSSRSSVNQNKFREKLFLRDGHCLLSEDDDDESLVPAHIIPFSLGQDFLDTLTMYPRQVELFSVTNGLLLRSDLHRAYDRYRWGIFVNPEGRHFVHVFGVSTSYRGLHGKEIHYRSRNIAKLPNIHLLRWQYRQCLMARIRGCYIATSSIHVQTSTTEFCNLTCTT